VDVDLTSIMFFGTLTLLGIVVIVAVAVAVAIIVWWQHAAHAPRPSGPAPSPALTDREPMRLSERLQAAYRAGQHDQVLRSLEREMPAWPVGSSLIEVARALIALEQRVRVARDASVPEPVTSRLTQEADRIAGPLWDLAERVAGAGTAGMTSSALQAELAGEDAKLVRLLAAIREARLGLVELTLVGPAGRDELRRAEGRFRALAETARELRAFEQGMTQSI